MPSSSVEPDGATPGRTTAVATSPRVVVIARQASVTARKKNATDYRTIGTDRQMNATDYRTTGTASQTTAAASQTIGTARKKNATDYRTTASDRGRVRSIDGEVRGS